MCSTVTPPSLFDSKSSVRSEIRDGSWLVTLVATRPSLAATTQPERAGGWAGDFLGPVPLVASPSDAFPMTPGGVRGPPSCVVDLAGAICEFHLPVHLSSVSDWHLHLSTFRLSDFRDLQLFPNVGSSWSGRCHRQGQLQLWLKGWFLACAGECTRCG